jgi:WD40 repeat protein
LSGNDYNLIKIWDRSKGTSIKTLSGQSSSVTNLIALDEFMLIKIWDVSSGSCNKALTGHTKSIKDLTRTDETSIES